MPLLLYGVRSRITGPRVSGRYTSVARRAPSRIGTITSLRTFIVLTFYLSPRALATNDRTPHTPLAMRLRVRYKLILLGILGIFIVSSAYTWINLALARRAIEEDFKTRAIVYAREIAANFRDRRELE